MSKTTFKYAGKLSDKSIARIRSHLIRRNKMKPDILEKKDA
tara:strand:+ start:324 stop:446 length:123 start_codon:yes stop_codon:yes gene_type:complete